MKNQRQKKILELIEKYDTLEINAEENKLATEIFKRLTEIPLIDRYEAFQLLDDRWQKMSGDIEMLQTEGLLN